MTRSNVTSRRTGLTQKSWWPWLKRIIGLGFFVLVATLLIWQAQEIAWAEVLAALKRYPMSALWFAAGLSASSLLLYSCFDLLGRRYTGHTLGTASVMTTTFVSYVFNLNLGSLVGAFAMRYRLYSRLGLSLSTITRVVTFSMLTNWMGYVLLAGLMFSVQPPALPDNWNISSAQLRLGGVFLLALALAYLCACALLKQRRFELRGHTIDLPSAPMALLQLLMGAANWLLMASIIYILVLQRIDLATVVTVLLLAAIAGVITHIPGNLGVLEGVFIALLSSQLPSHELLAGLLAYRLVYFLAPLSVAVAVFVGLEVAAHRRGDTRTELQNK